MLSRLAIAALVALVPADALAAACCVSATSGGFGRLRVWEQGAGGLSASMGRGLGYWGLDGEWHAYGETYAESEVRGTAWGMVRLSRRAQAWGAVPWLHTWRSGSSLTGAGGGVADVQAGLRYDILEVGEIQELPAIALSTSVLAPTGRSADRSEDALGADATGRGAVVLGLSGSVEWTLLPWFVRIDPGFTLPLPARRQDSGLVQRYGPGLAGTAIVGAELVPDALVVDARLWTRWEAAIHLDGESVEQSQRTTSGLGAGVAWMALPHWTLSASVDLDAAVSHLGDNAPGKATASAGVRYGHF